MADRTPKFGDRVTAIYAGENNPLRHGFYVRTVKRSGGLSPGTFYEITNGKGDFAQFPPESIAFTGSDRIDYPDPERR